MQRRCEIGGVAVEIPQGSVGVRRPVTLEVGKHHECMHLPSRDLRLGSRRLPVACTPECHSITDDMCQCHTSETMSESSIHSMNIADRFDSTPRCALEKLEENLMVSFLRACINDKAMHSLTTDFPASNHPSVVAKLTLFSLLSSKALAILHQSL